MAAWVEKSLASMDMHGIFESMRSDIWDHAAEQWGFMPQVCPAGQPCIDEIWNRLKVDVNLVLDNTLSQIMTDLGAAFDRTTRQFEEAWQMAQECDHGCRSYCSEQTIVYDNTITRITEIEQQIHELLAEHEAEIVITQEIITDCPQDVPLFEYEHYSIY